MLQALEDAKAQHLDTLKAYISYIWQQEAEKQTASSANTPPIQHTATTGEPPNEMNPQPTIMTPQEPLGVTDIPSNLEQPPVDQQQFTQEVKTLSVFQEQNEDQIIQQDSTIAGNESLVPHIEDNNRVLTEAEEAVDTYANIAYQVLQNFNFEKHLARPDALQVLDKLQRILEIPLILKKDEEFFITTHLKQANSTLIDLLKQQGNKLYELFLTDAKEIGQLHILLAQKLEIPLKITRETLEKNVLVGINTELDSSSPANNEALSQYCQKFVPMLIERIKQLSTEMIDKGEISYDEIIVLENAIRNPFKLKADKEIKEVFLKVGLDPSDLPDLPFDLIGSSYTESIFDLYERSIPLEEVWQALELIHHIKQYILNNSLQKEYTQKEKRMYELGNAQSSAREDLGSIQKCITNLKSQIEQVANESLEVQLAINQYVQKLLANMKDEEIEGGIKTALEINKNREIAIHENEDEIERLNSEIEQLDSLARQHQVAFSTYEL